MTWPFENDTSAITKKLAQRSFKANKLRNIVAVIAIVLTSMLFTSVTTLCVGAIQSIQTTILQIRGTSPSTGTSVNWIAIIAALFFIMIFVITGYLLIRNIFEISVVQEIKKYGLLRTIGTTEKQIKRIVYKQAFWLSIIGISIGLILGYIVGIVVRLVAPFQQGKEPNMEFIREDCIYARQSVDRKDSISIESQIDFCKYELKGGSCRVFKDKGYSGKNTDRPEFQKLLGEIRKGKVRRVIVYKLDRISRSILDFATMMELFQEYDVEFVSSTEKFDTSTPMGRAMLNICIVFAQLERETIQKRVTDAYYSRCLKGFHMSGQAPYGYQLEPTVVEGIRTKKMVADPVAADHVRLMFEMYAEPETSFGDITRYFEEHDIKIYGKSMFRTFLSQLLRNPVYAQADLELYEFFKSQGAAIVNDASDFAGTNGCYLYQGRDVKEDKDRCLKDQILVIAPHEALISSDTWLKCRKKLMANTTFQQGRKPKNTWLAGKIKCGHCGYALKATHVPNSTGYFRCTKRTENKGCPGCGKIRKEEFEQFIFSAMQEKFKDFQILHGREEKVNPKLTAYQVELAQVEAEIEKLLDTLTGANATLLAYANKKIEELDTRRQTISKAIAELSVETISPQQIKKLSYYLDNWDSIDFDDKRKAADGLISTIKATSDRVQIEWKI